MKQLCSHQTLTIFEKIREKNIECVYTPQNHTKIKFHIKGHLKKTEEKFILVEKHLVGIMTNHKSGEELSNIIF